MLLQMVRMEEASRLGVNSNITMWTIGGMVVNREVEFFFGFVGGKYGEQLERSLDLRFV